MVCSGAFQGVFQGVFMSNDDGRGEAGSAPWHDGERALQARTGMREKMEQRGRVVLRDHMPDQHRQFFAERNQLFIATLDTSGQPWATLVEGDLGFVTSLSPQRLQIAAVPPSADPAGEAFHDGAPIGVLGLEFETRRRNRLNGEIRYAPGAEGFCVDVAQSFGNCAQYIQARRLAGPPAPGGHPNLPGAVRRAASLTSDDAELICRADTFFISSRSSAPGQARGEGLDVSHRGGRPGFVRIDDGRRLTFPDYRGNFFFNTLGNLQLDARCGLLFIDFATGATLQVAGRATLLFEPEASRPWPGAERAVAIEIDAVVFSERRSRFSWKFLSSAPQFEQPSGLLKPFRPARARTEEPHDSGA